MAVPTGFVGRESELAQVEAMLARATRGESGALVVRGEAGVGKSALLGEAVRSTSGMCVLRACGFESESDLPFGTLVQLLRPVEALLDAIPARLAEVLKAALALGPTVPVAPLQTSVALLRVLAAAADRAPVLVVVDDVHWVDAASAVALLFSARRLGAEGIAMLFGLREGESGAPDTSGIGELALDGLDREAAQRVVACAVPEGLPHVVFERLYDATGGNPLALIESVRLLSPAERAGRDPLPRVVRHGQRIDRAFAGRVTDLPADARRALLVTAAADGTDAGEIVAASCELGLPPDALRDAEAAGLVKRGDGRIEFCHPLIRSVAYHGAAAGERRAAHDALATALARDAPARSLLHRAAATISPNEEIAAELELVALDSVARGGPVEAARVFEAAARLSPVGAMRSTRLLAASRNAMVGGDFVRAAEIADRGLADTEDGSTRAAFELQRGLVKIALDLCELLVMSFPTAPGELRSKIPRWRP